ncbi:MAG: hypothetical protein M3Q34_04455 [bacterium]|nr:hypothetical protein [bacterium]
MDASFLLKLVTLFFIGGGAIAALSFIAEKSSNKVAGIILSFPSTIVITFLFLACTESIDTVVRVAPTALIPLGVGLLFPIIYINTGRWLAKLNTTKTLEVAGSFIISTIFWLLISIPIADNSFSNVTWGIGGYFILTLIAHIILKKEKNKTTPPINYTTKQMMARASFIGFIIVLMATLSKFVSPFWGSIFAVFPAGVGSLLMIFHWQYSPDHLSGLLQKLPIGSLLIFVYIIAVVYFFPLFGPIAGTLISYILSLIVYLGIKKILKN